MVEERISYLCQNDCYYAHLSIYHFAIPFCKDRVVLDAGSGTGYGSAYLAEHGARQVFGLDADRSSVESSRGHFPRSNLEFQFQDLRRITGFSDHHFDVIFSSNSLEHIEGVESFFYTAWRLLKPSGILITAVPAARSKQAVEYELGNLHHVNIWSPQHWYEMHLRYFSDVRCHTHLLTKQEGVLRIDNDPEDTTIRETDFIFPEETLQNLCRNDNHTSLFLATVPVVEINLPSSNEGATITDYSISRPAYPGWIQPFLWCYYRIRYILRYEGPGSLLKKVARKMIR